MVPTAIPSAAFSTVSLQSTESSEKRLRCSLIAVFCVMLSHSEGNKVSFSLTDYSNFFPRRRLKLMCNNTRF